jgi:hypothetical protein
MPRSRFLLVDLRDDYRVEGTATFGPASSAAALRSTAA